MRVFFALLFDPTVKNHIYKEIFLLKNNTVDGKFSEKNNLHLTVEFIGDVDQEGLQVLKEILHSISFPAFEIQSTELGCFYNKSNKAILYLGIHPLTTLSELNTLLRSKLIEKGISFQDKAYSPHITLGRKVEFKEQFLLKTFNFPTMMMQFTKLSLMESININQSLVYRELDSVNFE